MWNHREYKCHINHRHIVYKWASYLSLEEQFSFQEPRKLWVWELDLEHVFVYSWYRTIRFSIRRWCHMFLYNLARRAECYHQLTDQVTAITMGHFWWASTAI